MNRKILSLLLALCLLLSLTACGDAEPDAPDVPDAPEQGDSVQPAADGGDESWAIYWYLCGSDLEGDGGFATDDLAELMEVELPEHVTVVIQTGGASTWWNDLIDAEKLQRWVYDSQGLTLVDEQPSASMGEASTLADFLAFANENYPASRKAVLFWNHGGGSVSGAAFDELYDLDSLTLDEMYAAFSSVWPENAAQPPLELIGFDTCLMATVDVAHVFSGLARYMVASEETEPANGWYYTGWAGALAEDPAMDGAALGRIICDTYYEGCQAVGTEENATLSLVDLTRTGPLLEAYESFGAEALAAACQDPSFFTQFARAAAKSENYGGNTRQQGYTNMVDLGSMARQSADMLDSSAAVLSALDDCVLYQVRGKYRAEATGLSCYYSYNGDVDDFNGYISVGAGEAFKYFYAYELTGQLDEDGMTYVADAAGLELTELPTVQTVERMDWDGAPLTLSEQGNAVLTLGPEAKDVLAGIGFSLYYVDEEADMMLLLGTDNDMTADWENGVFSDNFRGVWGSIDGCIVYMELSFESEDYNIYSVPVLLNGEEYNLQVAYDFTESEWYILGARRGIDESGMADKELRLLQEGDELTTIWYLSSLSGEDDPEPYTAETLTVTADTAFAETALSDGLYAMVFEMTDALGGCTYSEAAIFECVDGEIYTTV